MTVIKFLASLFVGFCAVAAVAAPSENMRPETLSQPTITIGLIDTFDPEFYLRTYVPTIEYLQEKLPGYRFIIREIDHRGVHESVARVKPDFLVSSASQFVSLISSSGAQQIVTKKRAIADDVQHSVASAFIVRADRTDLQSIADLRHLSVAATDERDFDGWLIALYAIARAGFEPENFFSRTVFSHYQYPNVLTMVKTGQTDVGILSTCQYEAFLNSGAIREGEIRVLNAPEKPEFCTRSTERFPDVVFSYLPGVDPVTVKDVTLALLSMPAAENDFEWIPSSGFLETFDLLKTLKIGPYAHLRETTIRAFIAEHERDLYFLLALVVAVFIHIVRVNVLVRRRTQELEVAEQERNRAQSAALENRKKLAYLEKSRAISQMGALFAHEVKQPITNMLYYASGIRMLLKQHDIHEPLIDEALGKLSGEARRTADIVEHVRDYARHKPKSLRRCDLRQIAEQAVRSLHADEHYGHSIHVDGSTEAWVTADAFEIELVVLNLIKNALTAVRHCPNPQVGIRIDAQGPQWVLTVSDNGPDIADEIFERLGKPQISSKHDGLGIGLSIAHDIIESHGGHLSFARRKPSGLDSFFSLPQALSGEPS